MKKTIKQEEYIVYHKAGSIRARGQKVGGVLTGYWEWFRLDGSILRSGHFEDGEQVGEWITYDKQGEVYKTTFMKPSSNNESS